MKQRGRLLSHLRNDDSSRGPDQPFENGSNKRLNLLSGIRLLTGENLAGDAALDKRFPLFFSERVEGFVASGEPSLV